MGGNKCVPVSARSAFPLSVTVIDKGQTTHNRATLGRCREGPLTITACVCQHVRGANHT